jgi:hypothetical protein
LNIISIYIISDIILVYTENHGEYISYNHDKSLLTCSSSINNLHNLAYGDTWTETCYETYKSEQV